MRHLPALLATLVALTACGSTDQPGLAARIASFQAMPGFYDLYWDDKEGRLFVRLDRLDEPFLYQSSLARGVGSNDLGLDRGQLGDTKVVEFQRSGPKVLLVEHNLQYRAMNGSPFEEQAVEESFARSVLWGFEVEAEVDGSIFIDGTDFFLRDSHWMVPYLADVGEGSYQTDASRSAIYLPRTKAFPANSEVEAIVTFTGNPTGEILETVAPDASTLTVHLHHSFIRLPDDDYEPLPFEPRAGFIGLRYDRNGFLDYASPIGEPLTVAYGRRHRLEKADPAAAVSEAVEPIVYYVDPGVPEPIRSALIEGASWWNEAFEAAGYRDAFRVELLPEDVDPMDVRYNVIQWVHRSTRGWSYGSSILDPRTGEIMKGHVTLGSLRVRQDFLIAEGLLAPYDGETVPDAMLEMSLSRIRQLSAHEVGHTLGIEHNFAASTQDRASVMDYPFPLIRFDGDGGLDLSDAYGTGVGAWDVATIRYGYSDFPPGADAQAGRDAIMAETLESGHAFVADRDSRDPGTLHPDGNLWDNGADAIAELEHLLRVREHALGRMSERNIRIDRPMATLEEVLVPIYLLHRYQLRAVGKLIGGQYFTYAMRGDGQQPTGIVGASRQRDAIATLLDSIDPASLRLPDELLDAIPPRPPGFAKTREAFPSSTGNAFDPLGPSRSAVTLTLDVLLEPTRAARMIAAQSRKPSPPGFDQLVDAILDRTWFAERRQGMEGAIQRATNDLALTRLMLLSADAEADSDVSATALAAVERLDNWLSARVSRESDRAWRAHYGQARRMIARMRDDPSSLESIEPVSVPPGSPIGN